MSTPPIIATYLIETSLPVEQTAEMIAGEQSSGTFLPVPGETEELKARARAQVVGIRLLEVVDQPSLRGSRAQPGADGRVHYQRAEIKLAFPFDNIGCNLPTLAATVCGNLYELAEHSGCKLLDSELPGKSFRLRFRQILVQDSMSRDRVVAADNVLTGAVRNKCSRQVSALELPCSTL